MIGKVYKIIHTQSEICYIGSTFNMLKHRFEGHKNNFKRWDEGKTARSCSIFPFFKEHGLEQFRLILIKEYDVADRDQLIAFEQLWINRFRKTCVNRNDTFAILADVKKKERMNQYYEINKEAITKKIKQKVNCECGGKYTYGSRARHLKLAKHVKWIEAQ